MHLHILVDIDSGLKFKVWSPEDSVDWVYVLRELKGSNVTFLPFNG